MNNEPTVPITQGQPRPKGLSSTNLWIEEVEDLAIRQLQPRIEVPDEASCQEVVTRNIWIEEEEDLTIRPLPPETVVENGATLRQVAAATTIEEARTPPVVGDRDGH